MLTKAKTLSRSPREMKKVPHRPNYRLRTISSISSKLRSRWQMKNSNRWQMRLFYWYRTIERISMRLWGKTLSRLPLYPTAPLTKLRPPRVMIDQLVLISLKISTTTPSSSQSTLSQTSNSDSSPRLRSSKISMLHQADTETSPSIRIWTMGRCRWKTYSTHIRLKLLTKIWDNLQIWSELSSSSSNSSSKERWWPAPIWVLNRN